MKRFNGLLLFLALLLPLSACSTITMLATDGRVAIRLFLEACENPVKDIIKPEFSKDFKTATVTVKNGVYKACWFAPEGDDIVIIMEDGTAAGVPKAAFVPEEGV